MTGRVEMLNSGGDISLAEGQGEVVAHTSSGSIKVLQARDAVAADTSSGEIAVSFSAVPKADCRLEVSGGGIQVGLPPATAVDLDARSSGGRVISDLPVTTTVQGRQISGTLQGKINGGGPALVLRSSSGDIRLKKSPGAPMAAEDEAPAK
jgi:DUF4097 and DUF4098 domain-containing protein YvlB